MQDLIAQLKAHAELQDYFGDEPYQLQLAKDLREAVAALKKTPLNDAEIDGAMLRSIGPTTSGIAAQLRGFAREVERAHGITGE